MRCLYYFNRSLVFKLCLGLFCIASITNDAHALLSPSFFILKRITQRHETIHDLRIINKISLFRNGNEIKRVFNEVIVVPNHEVVSIKISDEGSKFLVSHTRKMSTLQSAKGGDLQRPVLYDLTLLKDFMNVFEHFRALGLPLKTEQELYAEKTETMPYKPEEFVQLKRMETKLGVVIADKSRLDVASNSTTQLWVEKDSFLPLRAIVIPPGSDAIEFRFSHYQPHRTFVYPHQIDVLRDGKLWLKIETLEIKAGAGKLDDPKINQDMDGDVKEFLDQYFKLVR